MARARIVIADDNKAIRDKAARLLEPEFDVVEMVADGEALMRAVFVGRPEVCVVDICMPRINGIEAAAQLKKSGVESKILFLTVHEDPDFLRAGLDTGAAGYVVKSRMATDLCAAVRVVISGERFVSPTSAFNPES